MSSINHSISISEWPSLSEAAKGKRKQPWMTPEQESAMYSAASQHSHADMSAKIVGERVLAEKTTQPAIISMRYDAEKKLPVPLTPEEIDEYINWPIGKGPLPDNVKLSPEDLQKRLAVGLNIRFEELVKVKP